MKLLTDRLWDRIIELYAIIREQAVRGTVRADYIIYHGTRALVYERDKNRETRVTINTNETVLKAILHELYFEEIYGYWILRWWCGWICEWGALISARWAESSAWEAEGAVRKKSVFSSMARNTNIMLVIESDHDLDGLRGENCEFDIRYYQPRTVEQQIEWNIH